MMEAIMAAIVIVICTPLGWIGMICAAVAIAIIVEAFKEKAK